MAKLHPHPLFTEPAASKESSPVGEIKGGCPPLATALESQKLVQALSSEGLVRCSPPRPERPPAWSFSCGLGQTLVCRPRLEEVRPFHHPLVPFLSSPQGKDWARGGAGKAPRGSDAHPQLHALWGGVLLVFSDPWKHRCTQILLLTRALSVL